MTIKIGKGKASVTIEGPLAEDLERELRSILGPVADEIDREAEAIMAKIKAEWPVKSGKSRDSWSTALRVIPDSFCVDAAITSDVEYVRYMKSTKVGRKNDSVRIRSPLQTLVRAPSRAAAKALRERLPAVLARHLSDVLDG